MSSFQTSAIFLALNTFSKRRADKRPIVSIVSAVVYILYPHISIWKYPDGRINKRLGRKKANATTYVQGHCRGIQPSNNSRIVVGLQSSVYRRDVEAYIDRRVPLEWTTRLWLGLGRRHIFTGLKIEREATRHQCGLPSSFKMEKNNALCIRLYVPTPLCVAFIEAVDTNIDSWNKKGQQSILMSLDICYSYCYLFI